MEINSKFLSIIRIIRVRCIFTINKYYCIEVFAEELLAFIDPAIVLSMCMLSIIFVIVCSLFEWKRICAGILSFVNTKIAYALPWEIQLSRG